MMKKRKEFLLDESTISVLEQYQNAHHLKSMAKALAEIIDGYKHRNETDIVVEEIAKQVAAELSDTLTRIRLGANNADRNSDIIVMLLNTMLSYQPLETLITEETPQLAKARQIEKDRIAYFRQTKLDHEKKGSGKSAGKKTESDPLLTDDDLTL